MHTKVVWIKKIKGRMTIFAIWIKIYRIRFDEWCFMTYKKWMYSYFLWNECCTKLLWSIYMSSSVSFSLCNDWILKIIVNHLSLRFMRCYKFTRNYWMVQWRFLSNVLVTYGSRFKLILWESIKCSLFCKGLC